MKQTRRQLIASLAGIVVGASKTGEAKIGRSSAGTNMHWDQTEYHRDNNMVNRKAFVTLPAFCPKYLYAHLHELMKKRPRPVIIMDAYDYERMWGQIVMEREKSMQMVGMITDALRRQGLVKLIDYRDYYSADKQKQNSTQCQNAVESLSDHKQQAVAVEAAEGFFDHFQQLDRQQSFRQALENWDHALYRRSQAKSRLQRLKKGGGAPLNRAERIAMQYTAALEVRNNANEKFDLNVIGVIGQGESKGVGALLQDSSFNLDDDVATLRGEKSIKEIRRFDPASTAFERSVLDSITHVAQETTKTQHNDWYLLGSHLAVPHFPKLFVESWSQPNIQKNTQELAAETREVLSLLKQRAEDDRPAHLQDDAEAIAEQHGDISPEKVQEITEELKRAADLSNCTPLLRDLSETDLFSPGAIMGAASIIMDPPSSIDKDETLRRAWSMKQRNRSVTVPSYDIERYSNRGGFQEKQREQNPDWYQSTVPEGV